MESIQITGNKARFDNYLSSPLVIPENAKVCLNKASFSIPVWTQKYINVPTIDAADFDAAFEAVDDTCFCSDVS